jgi:hypothetical protein
LLLSSPKFADRLIGMERGFLNSVSG